MLIERRSVHDLSNDPANARKHNDRNIDAIVASLRRFGQQKPIVIDKTNIVRAGNGTLEAARRLGLEFIDCVTTSLQGSDAIAYAIADNRTAELAEWDEDTLAAQLNGLLTESEEIALAAGFTASEIDTMMVELMANAEGETGDEGDEEDALDVNLFSCPVTVDQELKLREAIAKAKKEYDVKTTGDAISMIAEYYLG